LPTSGIWRIAWQLAKATVTSANSVSSFNYLKMLSFNGNQMDVFMTQAGRISTATKARWWWF
jgi:hypothetical protein